MDLLKIYFYVIARSADIAAEFALLAMTLFSTLYQPVKSN